MKASETGLLRIIEGTNQYLVPHFQRPYKWDKKQWITLWEDLLSIFQDLNGEHDSSLRHHFMGSIVTMPGHSVPEGISKYLLIDGQQRLTTIFILLIAIRNRAEELEEEKLASSIHDLYLINRYQDGTDEFKLLPTQGEEPSHNDRKAFISLINREKPSKDSRIWLSFIFFYRHIKQMSSTDLNLLKKVIMSRLLLVSIVLEKDDNPYAIFESLNAKGQPLSQADLIRNYFFMSIDAKKHDDIFKNKWRPMEVAIGQDSMTEYLRHYIMSQGLFVKQSEVYFTLKAEIENPQNSSAVSYLDKLSIYSTHYRKFLRPDLEEDKNIKNSLHRINRLQATVCYPFLLNLFHAEKENQINQEDLIKILNLIENFLVRRYVCGTIRAELNKIFPTLYSHAQKFSSILEGVREILASRNYPSDTEFYDSLLTKDLYGVGDKKDRAKLILERLEEFDREKEPIDHHQATIEHIMPQKLSPWWRDHLGPDADSIHSIHLHTIGNLTLTGYNSEMSNDPFPKKKIHYQKGRYHLNSYLCDLSQWQENEISERADHLAKLALMVWPNISPKQHRERIIATGSKPKQLEILREQHEVTTWQDVLKITITTYCDLGEDILNTLAEAYPRHISTNLKNLKKPKPINESTFYESHLNADQIHKICQKFSQAIGFTSSDWRVEVE